MTGRKRKGVKATAVITAAMAALTASQAPGATAHAPAPAKRQPAPRGAERLRRHPVPHRASTAAGARSGSRYAEQGGCEGSGAPVGGALPATVLAAYRQAEDELADSRPGCRLRWQLLAAIGQVESGQARGGRVSADGTTLAPILGPRLDGNGFAAIGDTDGGLYDGDTAYDRAVGPMQFIPSTWAVWGADGNGDGRSDPGNIYDAALAAGRYLCAGGRDLSDAADLDRAILGYNHSAAYLRTVRAWFAYYLEGHRVVPDQGAGPAVRPKPKPSHTNRGRRRRSAAPARPADASGGPNSSPTPAPSPSPVARVRWGRRGAPVAAAIPVPASFGVAAQASIR